MCNVAASSPPLSSFTPHCSLSLFLCIPSLPFSHVTACFRGSEQKFLPASWLIPPPYSTSTHLPSSTHLSSLTPSLTLLLSSQLVPHLPLLAARLEPAAFLRGRLPAVSINSLVAPALPLRLSTSLISRNPRCGVWTDGVFHPSVFFFFFFSRLRSSMISSDFVLILSHRVERWTPSVQQILRPVDGTD